MDKKKSASINKEKNDKLQKENDIWKVIDLYFKQNNILVSHLLESYNQFILEGIHSITSSSENIFHIDEFIDDKTGKYIIIKNRLIFSNFCIGYPTIDSKHGSEVIIYPLLARKRNLTYSGRIYASIEQVQDIYIDEKLETSEIIFKSTNNIDTDDIKNNLITIGRIPIMIGSEACILKRHPDKINNYECDYDPGGYFIINGNERVIVPQEMIALNRPIITKKEELNVVSYIAEIRCISMYSDKFSRLFKLKCRKDVISVNMSQFKDKNKELDIPIFIFFRALGIETDQDIYNIILGSPKDTAMYNLIKPNQNIMVQDEFGNEFQILTREAALNYLAKYLSRSIKIFDKNDTEYYNKKKINLLNNSILKYELFCHIENNFKHKAYFLGHLTKKLLNCVLGRRQLDDRDSFFK